MSEPALQRVAEVMTANPLTLTPGLEIVGAVDLLLKNDISGACVLDDEGELVGILTMRDCLKAALSASYYKEWGGTVADYMSKDPQVLEADDDLISACEFMITSPHRHFPILRRGEFAGQLSRTDVLKALSGQWK